MRRTTTIALGLALALGAAGIAGVTMAQQAGERIELAQGWGPREGGGWRGEGGGRWGGEERGGRWRGEGGGWGEGRGPGWRGGQGMGDGRMFERMFDFFDRNFDGAVDLEEFRLVLGQRFARLDANGDGAVTRDDIVARVNEARERYGRARRGPTSQLSADQIAERFLANFGKPGDGRVTREEFAARFEPIFRLFDRSGQGRVGRQDVRDTMVTMRMLRL